MNAIDLDRIRQRRVDDPDAVLVAARRRRTARLGERMVILAADHPARGTLAVGDRSMAMGDRTELLRRIVAALQHPGVDGVLGTPDILEDLLLLGVLDDKIVIGSMNRGGISGSDYELDDRFTGYDAATLAQMRFNGGKMLTRISLRHPDTARTLEAAANAVSALSDLNLMAMVEPFMTDWVHGHLQNDLSVDGVIRSIGIANGLGNTSRHKWLKLPVVPEMARVMQSTTLPALILGGDPSGPPEKTYADWELALSLPGVRGLVVGRALLYPSDDDVMAAVSIAAELVHGG